MGMPGRTLDPGNFAPIALKKDGSVVDTDTVTSTECARVRVPVCANWKGELGSYPFTHLTNIHHAKPTRLLRLHIRPPEM